MSAVLSHHDIHRLLEQKPSLVESCPNLDEQLQPNGFDLTLREVALLQSSGKIAIRDAERRLPELAPLAFNGLGFIDLVPGIYSITYNEIVHLPGNIMALARPRSSLLRCGVSVGTAVWDAGYSGRSQSLLVVYNTRGFRVQKNARIVQLVFLRLSQETAGYQGVYQYENID